MLDAEKDETLWVETYDLKLENLFQMQSKLAETIAEALQINQSEDQRERFNKVRSTSIEAYEAYNRGLQQLRGSGSLSELEAATIAFQRAINLDSTFAQAYIGLAETYMDYVYWARAKTEDVAEKAREAALKAIDLDPNLGEGYEILAAVALDNDWNGSDFKRNIDKAIQLSPNYARAHWRNAYYQIFIGNLEKAQKSIERAIDLDPLSTRYQIDRIRILYYSGNFKKAIEACEAILKEEPENNFILWQLAMIYTYVEDYNKAIQTFQKRSVGTYTNWALGYCYAKAGRDKEAQQVLDYHLQKVETGQYVPPVQIFYIYAAMGNTREAASWLQKAKDQKQGGVIWFTLCVDPWLKDIRELPEFSTILECRRIYD